jgi:8-oxo-dGTP diphosphatase
VRTTEIQDRTATSSKHWVSVAGVIIENGRALIIRRRDNKRWEPPGGVLENGESIEDGLVREVFEETGIRAEPVALTGVYKNMRRGIVALVFRCRAVEGRPKRTPEAIDFEWMTPEQIVNELDEAYGYRVLDAFNQQQPPSIRIHDGVRLL